MPQNNQYVDLSDQVESSMNEPDSPAKSPLHQKDIDVMVERKDQIIDQQNKTKRKPKLQDEILKTGQLLNKSIKIESTEIIPLELRINNLNNLYQNHIQNIFSPHVRILK